MPDLASLAPEIAILVVLLWFFDRKDKRQEKRDALLAKAFKQLSNSIDDNTTQTRELEKAVKSNDTYLRERNGRDNEMHVKLMEGFKALEKKIHA